MCFRTRCPRKLTCFWGHGKHTAQITITHLLLLPLQLPLLFVPLSSSTRFPLHSHIPLCLQERFFAFQTFSSSSDTSLHFSPALSCWASPASVSADVLTGKQADPHVSEPPRAQLILLGIVRGSIPTAYLSDPDLSLLNMGKYIKVQFTWKQSLSHKVWKVKRNYS